CVTENASPHLFKKGITLQINRREVKFDLYLLRHNNLNVYFVKKDEYYKRDYLYGTPQGDYPDNALRFGFFAKATIASIPHIGRVDILHCNDWQSALIPLYIRFFHKQKPEFSNIKVIFTIHNMAYQGLFGKSFMAPLGIPRDLFTPDGLEFYGRLNFMKAGIIYSDIVTTVSEGYSREILTQEFGCGLDGLLRTRERVLYGIINGVDYSIWNPATDRFIAERYTEEDLSGKEKCKIDVLREFGIRYDPKRPLIGMITRLAEQKGIDLVAEGIEEMLRLEVDFVLLGFGDEKYNNIFRDLSQRYKQHVGARIDFDNALAHKIEAGSDIFLIPSRYEPCGLNQMYSLKYGTVPVVRAVGGLDEVIRNFNPSTKEGNGFKFKDASSDALLRALKDAVDIFKDKKQWNTLLSNGFSCDYSWDSSAKKYEDLYTKLT
ncbi:MAG: glycogen/starch synthase, partial [Candidatus Omnitrophota bacterium]